jgi:biopolymer transport protein ExbB
MERAWNLIQQGGPTMVPLLLCSVLAVAVFCERMWALVRKRVFHPELLAELRAFRPGADPEYVEEVCERHPGALATVIAAVLDDPPRDREVALERVQSAGRRAVRDLDRGLLVLEIVGGISPLLGLFGTVLGMFETFQVITQQGLGDPSALSAGISEALVTTIFGLGIGIPTVVAHSYLSRRVDDLVLEVEEIVGTLIDRLYPDGKELAETARRAAS